MKKHPYRLVVVVAAAAALVLGSAASASAATIFVGKTGSGGGSCAKPNFKNIAAAVSAASANDTIHICKGTWTGASNRGIQFAKPLKFVGDGSGQTVIDAQGQDFVFTGTSGAIAVSKMAIKGGKTTVGYGAGVMAYDSDTSTPYDVTASNMVFTGNDGNSYGSAIYGDNVEVSDSSFNGNTADSDGTVYAETSATVTRSTFTDNTVGDDGGAVFVNSDGPTDYDLTVTDSVFTDNNGASGYYGGSLCAYDGGAKILRTTVKGGETAEYGGGLYSDENAVVADSVFEGNKAEYDGAGVYSDSDLDVSDTLFEGNLATSSGGGVYASGDLTSQNVEYSNNEADYGGGAYVGGVSAISRDVYDSNEAFEQGGALYAADQLTAIQTSFAANIAAGNAGAVYLAGGEGIFDQVLFSANTSGYDGGVIYSDSAVDVTVRNSTITGNSAANDYLAIHSGSNIVLQDSTVADNTSAQGQLSALNGYTLLGATDGDLRIGNSIIKGEGYCAADGAPINDDFNVITTDSPCDDFVGPNPAAKVTDLALDLKPLADNGGPTRTRAIPETSAAANTGDTGCPTVDQRNWTRVGACDSGAFGIGALAPKPTIAKSGKAGAKSLKVRVGCVGGSPCTIVITGKRKGGKGKLKPKTVQVPEGETLLVTMRYTSTLARELAVRGGRQTIRVTATRVYGASRSVDVPYAERKPKPVTG